MYGLIIARNIKVKSTGSTSNSDEMYSLLSQRAHAISQSDQIPPDLIIAGSNIICMPAVGPQFESPFFVKGSSRLAACQASQKSFGIGISILSWALESIMLGNIYWAKVIAAGLAVPLINDEKIV